MRTTEQQVATLEQTMTSRPHLLHRMNLFYRKCRQTRTTTRRAASRTLGSCKQQPRFHSHSYCSLRQSLLLQRLRVRLRPDAGASQGGGRVAQTSASEGCRLHQRQRRPHRGARATHEGGCRGKTPQQTHFSFLILLDVYCLYLSLSLRRTTDVATNRSSRESTSSRCSTT